MKLLSKYPFMINYHFIRDTYKTIFHLLIKQNNFELFKKLLKINPKGYLDETNYQRTCFEYAIKKKNLEIIKYILSLGIDINHQNWNKEGYLHLAV